MFSDHSVVFTGWTMSVRLRTQRSRLKHEVRDGDLHEVHGLDHAVHSHQADRRIARYKGRCRG